MSAGKQLDRATLDIPVQRDATRPRLQRVSDEGPAGLWITSLPWDQPQSAGAPSLNGKATHAVPLGQWPDRDEHTPRRWLLIADGEDDAPEQVELKDDNPAPQQAAPEARMVRFKHSADDLAMYWENHLLCLTFGQRSVGLALGLRRRQAGLHWWEGCNLVITERTEHCITLEMGGAIPVEMYGAETFDDEQAKVAHPWVHRHNWIYGHLFVRAHANGVCEVYAHHINSKFVDDGAELRDVVPVIGMRVWEHEAPADEIDEETETDAGGMQPLLGAWDGSRTDLALDSVRFDLSEAALLASENQPGHIDYADNMLVWQPYTGVEIYGGMPCAERTGNPYICHAEEHRIPRGAARTVPFSLSLGDRSARVARYVAEPWWYGHLAELTPMRAMPVSNKYDYIRETGRRWVDAGVMRRGFEVGGMPRSIRGFKRRNRHKQRRRHRSVNVDPNRNEPGWEGEVPYAEFVEAWRTGDASLYQWALRSAYHFTDVVVDHATKQVRMHGYPPHAFSVPMMRAQGTIAGYLETGDPYLRQTGEALVETAFRWHRNAWPRMASGRDSSFIRSAVLLWRYFANPHFRDIARDAIYDTIATQRADGSFGDQGGGTGIHSRNGYITKPWMCLYAINGVLDYLEVVDPDEPRMNESVQALADWVMRERWDRGDGFRSLSYQHPTLGMPTHFNGREWVELPTEVQWHHDALARLLAWVAVKRDDAGYLDAWAESRDRKSGTGMDQHVAGILQFITWIQTRLWHAGLDAQKKTIRIEAIRFGERTSDAARIDTPDGSVGVRWTGHDKIVVDDSVVIESPPPSEDAAPPPPSRQAG